MLNSFSAKLSVKKDRVAFMYSDLINILFGRSKISHLVAKYRIEIRRVNSSTCKY